jgi:DNA polymerase-3 subunit epsilon
MPGALCELPIADLEVLIVDCQTTGASPAQGSVLELGWCVTRASDGVAESSAQACWVLPREGERISAQVRQLTGFHEGVLETALGAEAAWERLRASLGGRSPMPAAIHFARFELSFLKHWWERFEPSVAFPLEAVCVHAIACKLYPDLPRRNLRALAGFLGHSVELERRALGHVQATAFLWRRLVGELSSHGITRWGEVSEWLTTKPKGASPRKRRYPLAPATYRNLPDQPGVYRFFRSNGDLLYVGKATSLKKRVSSHFTKQSGATERALEMLTQVSRVSVTATATALEAALLETQTIKELAPPYNVQLLLAERGVWFAGESLRDLSPEPSEVYRVGPLPSRYALRALAGVARLLAGEGASDALRAACVGAPTRFGPDEASFGEGWRAFAGRHLTGLPEATPRRRALELGRRLLAITPEEPEASADSPKQWDGARVCRHLERAVAQAFRLFRRASWLCLLAEASVAYREPGAPTLRFLVLRQAAIVETADLPPERELPVPRRLTALQAAQAFDTASYDALRILTTELKRILRDGGDVSVRLSRSRVLGTAQLARILSLV